MRSNYSIFDLASVALLTVLAASPVKAKSFSPKDFELTLKDEDTLEIAYGSSSITVDAGDAWSTVESTAGKTYTYKGAIKIGDFSISDVVASIGPDGAKFIASAGFNLGELTLSAGELALEMLPGDQITDQPDFLTFDSEDFVLYTAISTGLEIGIGSNASFSIPTPGDISAALAVEVKKGSLYYEGPIPNPTMLANGVSNLVESPSDDDNMLSGGFGFSVDGDFTYESVQKVYQSSKDDPEKEKFSANVVMVGEFELADMATVEGNLLVDVTTGKVGVNAAAVIGYDVLGASASMEVGTGSFVVDKDGVRFGLEMGVNDDFGLPSSLDNIAHFLVPGLGAEMTATGTLNTGGDFLFAISVDDLDMYGIELSDAGYSLSPDGLTVSADMKIDGLGKVKASGQITDDSCFLDVEKFKFLSFNLNSPKIKPCDMAEDAMMAFAGEFDALAGYVPLEPIKVEGIAYANDALKAFLLDDYGFSVDFSIKEKLGVSGGLAGGYVKLAASGGASMTISTTGDLSGEVDFDGSAKFCGKVNVSGMKISKCKKVTSGISQKFDASAGCIEFSAETKILKTPIKLDAGKVCPWPDTGSYSESADYDVTDELDSDDLGTTIALKASDGKYVQWQSDHGPLTTTTSVSNYVGFTLIDFDDSKCLQDGSIVAIRQGDKDSADDDWYMRVKKDKSSALDGAAGDYGDGKKKFYIGKVKMADTCLSDGDVITLKNKEYKRYWSDSNGTIVATNDKDDSNFTVVFDPGWE